MIADQGYCITKRPLKNQNWYRAHKNVSKKPAKALGIEHTRLTKVQKSFNNQIYRVHARVEGSFWRNKNDVSDTRPAMNGRL
jgi:hypothetical protein